MRKTLYRLNDDNLARVLRHARWRLLRQNALILRPALFAATTSFGMFSLLSIMPAHPMSIPISVGGGLSFALLCYGGPRKW